MNGETLEVAVMPDGLPCERVERNLVVDGNCDEVRVVLYVRGAEGVYEYDSFRLVDVSAR